MEEIETIKNAAKKKFKRVRKWGLFLKKQNPGDLRPFERLFKKINAFNEELETIGLKIKLTKCPKFTKGTNTLLSSGHEFPDKEITPTELHQNKHWKT